MHTLLSSCSSPGAPEWPGLGCSPCSRGVSSIPGSCENVCTATCPGPACCPSLLNVKKKSGEPENTDLGKFWTRSHSGHMDPGLLLPQHQCSLPHFGALGAALANSIFTNSPKSKNKQSFSIKHCCDLLQNNVLTGVEEWDSVGVTMCWDKRRQCRARASTWHRCKV